MSGLLDDKLIKVISLFFKYPDKRFYLSEVSRLSGVNNTTTFRILNKLIEEDFIKVMVLGKVRTYRLSKSEKVNSLSKLLKKEDNDALSIFCERMKNFPRIRKVLLDSRTERNAKVIIIGDFSSRERIERISREIYAEKNFKISFVELTPIQYEGLKGSNTFSLDKRVLFSND